MAKLIIAVALALSVSSVASAQQKSKRAKTVLVTKHKNLECVHMKALTVCSVR